MQKCLECAFLCTSSAASSFVGHEFMHALNGTHLGILSVANVKAWVPQKMEECVCMGACIATEPLLVAAKSLVLAQTQHPDIFVFLDKSLVLQ